GVTEKKTHSSSLEEHEAEKVRVHFKGSAEATSASKPTRSARPSPDEIKTKIDLSHISKPGDVLKAIISRQQPTAAPPAQPGPPIPPARPAAASPAAPPAPKAPAAVPGSVVPPAPPRVPASAPSTPTAFTPSPPVASAGAPARPAPGRPVPGQPIFQRQRPVAPPPRPLRAGERRPMHPTRQGPAGSRPLGVGPGLAAPPGSTRPGSRPGGP